MGLRSHNHQKHKRDSAAAHDEPARLTRGFAPQLQTVTEPAPPDLQAMINHAQRYGHTLSKGRVPPSAAPPPIQAKRTVGAPNDQYEQKTDRVADQVVNTIYQPQGQPSIQREVMADDDELQRSPEPIQRVEMPEADQVQRLSPVQRRVDGGREASADLASGIASARGSGQALRSNRTGLPDPLKSGIESLSGMALDNVKVHYNSAQPAQLNALAYTQGSDIHVAPGQEQHLPHEAWHVVQQAQGRVKPTIQMKDGVTVNDDQGLEREADVMGAKALQSHEIGAALHRLPVAPTPAAITGPIPIQGMFEWVGPLIAYLGSFLSAAKPQDDIPTVDMPKLDTPEVEASKLETPTLETPKLEIPKLETPKLETPKLETPKLETPKPADKVGVTAPVLATPSLTRKTESVLKELSRSLVALESIHAELQGTYYNRLRAVAAEIKKGSEYEKKLAHGRAIEITTTWLETLQFFDEQGQLLTESAKSGVDRDNDMIDLVKGIGFFAAKTWSGPDRTQLDVEMGTIFPPANPADKIGLMWPLDQAEIMEQFGAAGGNALPGQVGTVCTQTMKAGGHYTFKGRQLDMYHSSHGNQNGNANDSRTAFVIQNPTTKNLEVVGIGNHAGPATYNVIFFNGATPHNVLSVVSAQPDVVDRRT
jgi:Domain of unknown function (DUF4157)